MMLPLMGQEATYMNGSQLNQNALGQNICRMRREHGWSQKQLAAKALLSESHLSRLERGVCGMSVSTFFALCRALECTPGELLQGAE